MFLFRPERGLPAPPRWHRGWAGENRPGSELSPVLRSGPDPPVPDSVHPGADRPAGEGVLPGELRVQAAAVWAGGCFKPAGNHHQGETVEVFFIWFLYESEEILFEMFDKRKHYRSIRGHERVKAEVSSCCCCFSEGGRRLMFDPLCLRLRCGSRTAGWKTNASAWPWRGLTPPTRPSTPTWWATPPPRGTCRTPSRPTSPYLTTPPWGSGRPPLRPRPLSRTLCAPWTASGSCPIPTRGQSSCAPSDILRSTQVTASVRGGVPAPAWPATRLSPTGSPDPPARTSLAPQRAERTLLSLSRLRCSANPHLWH